MLVRARPARSLRLTTLTAGLCAASALAGCGDGGTVDPELEGGLELCQLPDHLLTGGAVPEAIPALTEPVLERPDEVDHLEDGDRILGLVIDGEARAYPHPILWSHEIINDRFDDRWVSVSFCPLTGSGLAMDANVAGRRVEFAVSGLLFANNLVMFDRITEDLYGPQLGVEGKCQRFAGASPRLVGVREMSWGRWKELYPQTRVLSDDTGHSRNYRWYPYGGYDQLSNDDLLFDMEVDDSRPIKERVLAVRTDATGGRGYPFGELATLGERGVVNEVVGGAPLAVFWEEAHGQAALAYESVVDGRTLTFEAAGGAYRDLETGSLWSLAGRAVEGPLAGASLEPRADAFVVFWFAWRHFQPDGVTWEAP